MEELLRSADMGAAFGVEVERLDRRGIGELWPMARTDDLLGGIDIPKDGQTSPTDTAAALARGARQLGVTIVVGLTVTGIRRERGAVIGVSTDSGEISVGAAVNCCGMWARAVGQMAGVSVPLHAAEHFYAVTEPMAGATPHLPILRDPDGCSYYKEDAGKLLIGAFEPVAKPWGMDGIPDDFEFDSLPSDIEHFEPIMHAALDRVPALAETGIRLWFNGPESFTPDDRYLIGPAPEVENFFVAADFNSIGIQSAGGVGKVMADWIADGHPGMDLWDVDIRRMQPFQSNSSYLFDRTKEGLGLLYAMHWPHRQFESARGARKSILHDQLAAAGACFGEAGGWERANWFAPKGVDPVYEYSYDRQNWFDYRAAEHRAVREQVALFDLSSFAKIRVEGPDAEMALERICANSVAVAPGTVMYTQMLNDQGGIESDVTVTRLDDDAYLVVSGWDGQVKDFGWLRRNIGSDLRAYVFDATSGIAVLGIMGPASRRLLAGISGADLSNDSFPFATSQTIEIGYARVRASRITYVGELGWELAMPAEFAPGVYDVLIAAGAEHGLRHAGVDAMQSLRMEKGYRSWGHDISSEDTPLEAGLSFAVAWDKPSGFRGREALLRQRQTGVRKRLVQFRLTGSKAMVYHNEPILRDGKIVGYVTSGEFGHTLNAPVCMGYVRNDNAVLEPGYLLDGSYQIQIAGRRYAAEASLQGFYDPKSLRVRA